MVKWKHGCLQNSYARVRFPLVPPTKKRINHKSLPQNLQKMNPENRITPIREVITEVKPSLLAEKLRQQAGVDCYGWGALNTPHKPDIATNWILTGEEQTGIPQIELETKYHLTIGDLVEIRDAIEESVRNWFEGQKANANKELVGITVHKPEIEIEAQISLIKIRILKEILGGKSQSIETILRLWEDFITQEILQGKDNPNPQDKSFEEIYRERARKILIENERSDRAIRLMELILQPNEASLKRLSVQLETEIFMIASQVNHLRLLENLDEWIKSTYKLLNFIKIKKRLEKITAIETKAKKNTQIILPIIRFVLEKIKAIETNDSRDELTLKKAKKITQAILPIIRFVAEIDPDPDTFLLSQCLKHKNANCAGKEMMLGLILQDLNLEPLSAHVIVDTQGRLINHVATHIRIGRFIIEIDPLHPPTNKWQEKFGCLVNILEETEEFTTEYPNPNNPDNPKTQWVREKNGWRKLLVIEGGATNRITTEGKFAGFSLNNLAAFFMELAALESKTDKEKEKELLPEARRLLEEAIRINPNNPAALINLANLISSYSFLDLTKPEEKGKLIRRAKDLFKRAIKIVPQKKYLFENLLMLENKNI